MSNIVIVGFGTIGQAILPFLRQKFPFFSIVALDQECDALQRQIAEEYAVNLIQVTVTSNNASELLKATLSKDDFLLNLASEVCSLDLLHLARESCSLYIDAGIEPWCYEYGKKAHETSNAALRRQILTLRQDAPDGPTAVVAQGANPGFISVLVRQALWEMALRVRLRCCDALMPGCQTEWAQLAAELDVRVIQVSEYDSQVSADNRPCVELWNTWSVDGFLAECQQPAEIGLGTHECLSMINATSEGLVDGAIQLNQSGWETRVRSWSPLQGEFEALLLPHHESISIAQFLTLGPRQDPDYRPTVYYAYRPAACGLESAEAFFNHQASYEFQHRVIKDEIVSGIDELGVLLLSKTYGGLWYGSALSIERTRTLMPLNNATSLQVASSIISAMLWAVENPQRGILEAEDIDHRMLFDEARYYWEPLQCVQTSWTPESETGSLGFGAFLSKRSRLAKPELI